MVFLLFFFLPVVFCSARRCALLLIREAGCCRSSNPRLQLVSTNWGDSTNSFSGTCHLKDIYIYIYYIYYIYIHTIYIPYIYTYIYILYIYTIYMYHISILYIIYTYSAPMYPQISFHVEKCETRTVLG